MTVFSPIQSNQCRQVCEIIVLIRFQQPPTLPQSISTFARTDPCSATQRQVGAMLGLDYWQTGAFLNKRAVPLNYSAADLAADHATLEKILPRP